MKITVGQLRKIIKEEIGKIKEADHDRFYGPSEDSNYDGFYRSIEDSDSDDHRRDANADAIASVDEDWNGRIEDKMIKHMMYHYKNYGTKPEEWHTDDLVDGISNKLTRDEFEDIFDNDDTEDLKNNAIRFVNSQLFGKNKK